MELCDTVQSFAISGPFLKFTGWASRIVLFRWPFRNKFMATRCPIYPKPFETCIWPGDVKVWVYGILSKNKNKINQLQIFFLPLLFVKELSKLISSEPENFCHIARSLVTARVYLPTVIASSYQMIHRTTIWSSSMGN